MHLPTEPHVILSARALAASPSPGRRSAVDGRGGDAGGARFMAKVALPADPAECWRWTAGLDRYGYARFKPTGSDVPAGAHRVAYEMFVGPLPADRPHLDHLCHGWDATCAGGPRCPHRSCVNPFHLEPVTNAENRRRAAPARRLVCTRGHDYSEANTYRTTAGTRRCRLCRSEDSRRRRSSVGSSASSAASRGSGAVGGAERPDRDCPTDALEWAWP